MTGGPWLVVGIGIIVVVLVGMMVMFAPASPISAVGGAIAPHRQPPPAYARRPSFVRRVAGQGRRLHVRLSPRRPRRRTDSVGRRFERAMGRIDTVDPYDAQRRIGEAIVVAGLVEEPDRQTSPTADGGPVDALLLADRRGDRGASGRTPRIEP